MFKWFRGVELSWKRCKVFLSKNPETERMSWPRAQHLHPAADASCSWGFLFSLLPGEQMFFLPYQPGCGTLSSDILEKQTNKKNVLSRIVFAAALDKGILPRSPGWLVLLESATTPSLFRWFYCAADCNSFYNGVRIYSDWSWKGEWESQYLGWQVVINIWRWNQERTVIKSL